MKFEVPKEYRNSCGIYSMTNIVNNKRLIGQTTNFRARFGRYNGLLVKGIYKNGHLQNAFKKYGTDNIRMELVNLCDRENLTEMENYFCKAFNTMDRNFGYNLKDPITHSMISEETRKRMSEKMMGKKHSLGYKHTSAAKKDISDALIGNKKCVGRKPWNKGIEGEYSEDYIEKIRKAHIGKKCTEETKRRMSESAKGRKNTEESKKKLSESRIKLFAERRAERELKNEENNLKMSEGF